jgi:hypothetical protein
MLETTGGDAKLNQALNQLMADSQKQAQAIAELTRMLTQLLSQSPQGKAIRTGMKRLQVSARGAASIEALNQLLHPRNPTARLSTRTVPRVAEGFPT